MDFMDLLINNGKRKLVLFSLLFTVTISFTSYSQSIESVLSELPSNFSIPGKVYHVSVKGNDANNGSAALPFKTISAAVKLAFPGDTITVHAGT
jgi:hypothetical protein